MVTSAFTFDWIFFILADNADMHGSLNEFEFPPDPTTDYGVTCTCPLASEKSNSYVWPP